MLTVIGHYNLPVPSFYVVCMRVLGLTYREIARRQGLTTAGAEARHERGMNLFPPLRQMFARKTAKVAMRKKQGSVSRV
ncbi:MAG: hypothetical protein WCI20_08990 [bacterium]